MKIKSILLSIFLLFFIGCGDNEAVKNKSPIANITVNKTTLNVSETLILDAGKSSDSDGNIVAYEWTENNKRFGAPTNKTTWLAPNIVGNYILTLTVTDNDGASSQKSITITVEQEIITDREIFIIGDSTVHIDHFKHTGWGDKLDTYLKTPSKLTNAARGGSSSRSYKVQDPGDTSWDWEKLKQTILDTNTSTGAYLMIQFGHNDIASSLENDIASNLEDALDTTNKTTMPGRNQSFYNELKEYITWSKDNHIIPVLITPVEPMNQKYGDAPMERYYDRDYGSAGHDDYAITVKELAEDENVIILDLEEKSWQIFNSYDNHDLLISDFGVAQTAETPYGDDTHFNPTGAATVSGWVKDLACDVSTGDAGLCAQFK